MYVISNAFQRFCTIGAFGMYKRIGLVIVVGAAGGVSDRVLMYAVQKYCSLIQSTACRTFSVRVSTRSNVLQLWAIKKADPARTRSVLIVHRDMLQSFFGCLDVWMCGWQRFCTTNLHSKNSEFCCCCASSCILNGTI